MGSLFALGSSLLWGTADFLGGRATRIHGALRVLAWSQLGSLVLIWLAVAIGAGSGAVEVSARAVLVGMVGGVAGVVGLIAFYSALAAGPMVLVPPLAATAVALPVAVGLATGELPSTVALIGLAVAVLGVVLASSAPADAEEGIGRIAPRTLLLCMVAAVGFALIFVALDIAAGDSTSTAFVATGGVRIGSLLTVVAALMFSRIDPRTGVGMVQVAGFVGIGVLDTGANLLFAVSATLGDLEVVAVLGSLYPAVTSLLAAVVLGERVGKLQLLGVLLTLGGVLALASG